MAGNNPTTIRVTYKCFKCGQEWLDRPPQHMCGSEMVETPDYHELHMGNNSSPAWAALHRSNGKELTAEDAPGYHRVPYTADGAQWPKAMEDWGWVVFASAWDAPVAGSCVSKPPLQPFRSEWAR